MANTILHKRSSTTGSTPTGAQLASGELALNTADGKVFMKNSSGTVIEVSYRDARARAALSGSAGVAYDSSTGAFTVDSTVATLTGTQTLTNKTLTAPTITNPTISSGGAFGTPTSLTLTNATGLPVSTGISGLGTGVATFLATPSSANLASAVTDETGSGALVFANSPTLVTPTLGAASATSLTTTGNVTVGGNATITGNLTVNGTTTTINSTAVSVDDINVILGDTASPSDATADGGGITLKGTTDKTLNYVNANTAWTSSENFDLLTGKVYAINGTTVLSGSSLGSGVTGSSLTSVGTIGTGTWQGTIVGPTYGGTGVNNGSKTITLGGNLTTSGAFATTLTSTASTNVTLPTTGTLATLAGTETLTGKTISGSSNTLSNIANSSLTNSSVTVGTTAIALGASSTTLAGLTSVTSTGFTGALTGNASTATALQTARTINGVSFDGSGNITITATATGALTIGTGLSGTSYNGSGAVTIAIDSTVATLTGAQTLTNKTLTGPNVSALYISDSSIIFEGATNDAFETTLTVTDPTADRTITLPNVDGTVITTGDTGTVTNTMLAGSIANAKLANSTISGVSLGSNLNALTIGTGLSGTSYNGSSGVTVAIDSTVATLTGTQTLTNKTLTAPTITSPTITGLFLNDGSLVFEGATADAFETTLAVVDPTADRTITLPDVTGTVITTGDTSTVTNTMLAGSIANAKLANSSTTIGTTAISLGSSSTTLAGLTSVTSTGFTGALTGNASTATALQTARTINGVSFDGTANVTTLTAGTGVSVSGTQVSIGQAVGTTSNVTFNDLTVSGNLTVSGTTTTINSTTLDVVDLNITVAKNAATATAANGAGLTVNGPATPATLTYSSADDRWNFNKTLNATLVGNVTGNVTGNASTVTNGVYTTDTGTVTNTMLAGSIANAKLTNSSVTVGTTAISLGASSTTLAGLTSVTSTGFTGALTGNASTATTLQTARNIQGVSFNGSADITVVTAGTGVAVSGTQVSIGQAVATTSSPTFASVTHSTSGIFNGATSGAITVQAAAVAGANTLTLPAATDTLVGKATTDTLTNKTIAAGSNTISGLTNSNLSGTAGITNANLANSAVTIGTTAISLGSSSTTLAGLTSVTSTGFTGALTGNASTATTLQTARNIQGVSFNGSADITVVTAGTGISVSGTAVTNTGVTSNVAGSNITVSGATGAVTIATSATPTFTGITSGYTRPSANSATAYQVQNAAGTSILNVDSTNNRVGVNNTAPAVAFHVTGAGAFTGEVTAYYSDKRLKENIKPIDNALEKVTQLHGVTYNANSVAVGLGFTDTDEQVGLLAQDVQAVLPQVVVPAPFDLKVENGKKVSKSGEDYITVKYEKIVALLVEAIKELNDKVESLEAQLGGGNSL